MKTLEWVVADHLESSVRGGGARTSGVPAPVVVRRSWISARVGVVPTVASAYCDRRPSEILLVDDGLERVGSGSSGSHLWILIADADDSLLIVE